MLFSHMCYFCPIIKRPPKQMKAGQEDKQDKRIRRKVGEGEQRIKQDNEDKLKKASPAYHWTEDIEPPCSANLMSAPCLVKVGGLSKTFIYVVEATRVQECSKVTRSSSLPPYMFFRLVAKDTQVPLILVFFHHTATQ